MRVLKYSFAAFVLLFASNAFSSEHFHFPYKEISGAGNMRWTDKRSDFNVDPWPFVFMNDVMLVEEFTDNATTGSKVISQYYFPDNKLSGAEFIYENVPTKHDWGAIENVLTETYGPSNPDAWTDEQKKLYGLDNLQGYPTLRSSKDECVIHTLMKKGDQEFQIVLVIYKPRFDAYIKLRDSY